MNETSSSPPKLTLDSTAFSDVEVKLRARLGEAKMTIGELLQMRPGAVLKLDAPLSEPVELWLNGSLVARGEIVAVEDSYGVRLTDVASAS